jgi:hypothetical protein
MNVRSGPLACIDPLQTGNVMGDECLLPILLLQVATCW